MATTLKNFVSLSTTTLTGSGYATNGVALALSATDAATQVNRSLAALLDKFTVDLSTAAYAKNGCFILTLAASTPVTVDFTSLSSLAVTAGDTTFAGWNELIFKNTGVNPVIISPGASNALRTPLAGTTPTFTAEASSQFRWHAPTAKVIDGTHKNLTFDPGALPCVIAVCVGGL